MSTTEKEISMASFITDVNKLAATFLEEAALKQKEDRKPEDIKTSQEALESVITQHVELFRSSIDQSEETEFLFFFNMLSATSMLFIGRAFFKSDKITCVGLLEEAYQKTGMSPEESDYIKKNVVSLLTVIVKKDKTYLETMSPDIQKALRASLPELVEATKTSEKTVAMAAETKAIGDVSELKQCFEAGASDKVKSVPRNAEELARFGKAIQYLTSCKPIDQYSPKNLWQMLYKVHEIISPSVDFYTSKNYIFVVAAGFFAAKGSYCDNVLNSLTQKEKQIIEGIKSKVNGFIRKWGAAPTFGGSLQDLQDTLMIDAFRDGNIQGKKLTFSEEEKAMIKQFYDVKTVHPKNVRDARMIAGLEKIIAIHKKDPFKAAAHLSMLIFHEHPWDDGNGRVARLVAGDILRRAGLPIVKYPNRKEYDQAVKKATLANDYDVFENFMKGLMGDRVLYTPQLDAALRTASEAVAAGMTAGEAASMGVIADDKKRSLASR